MKDRYLFKAKQKNWRKLPKEQWWITGYYILGFNEYEEPIHMFFEPTSMFYSHGETDGWKEIDIETLCQCTGLKDKNGNPIWENDIIRCKNETAIVIWDKSGWRINKWIKDLIWRKDLHYWANEYECGIEVIGNMFDNKDLLEKETAKLAIQNLEEIQQYREIGTVEECQMARDKQKAREVKKDEYCGFVSYECPACGHDVGDDGMKYCKNCGQRLGWKR